jgi:hypothetical protein
MNIYWSYKSVPELTNLPKAEQIRLWRKHYWRSIRISDALIGLTVIVVVTLVGMLMQSHSGESRFVRAIAGGLSGGTAFFIITQRAVTRMRSTLRSDISKESVGTEPSDAKL